MIYQGDCLSVLRTLDSESVNCCVTSPPYWGLRDYGHSDQLGLEPTFEEYIAKLCDIFDEVKRVLRPDGTLWVNIGDTYSADRGYQVPDNKHRDVGNNRPMKSAKIGVEPKSLCLIPMRFAIEMQNRGWIVRNTIIWHKPNCMPSSVKDRFTVDFEFVFFMVKSKKYWFETQMEPLADPSRTNFTSGSRTNGINPDRNDNDWGERSRDKTYANRNKRTVWTITTKPYREAHFAVYPPELIETPIKAGCPEFVCKKCGKARERIIERIPAPKSVFTNTTKPPEAMRLSGSEIRGCGQKLQDFRNNNPDRIIGYTDCGCNAGFEPGVVLDPFMGSGTTAIVAERLNRRWVGIELNPAYIEIANARIEKEREQIDIFREEIQCAN